VPGIDLDRIGQLSQPLQRVEEPFGALACLDGEVGPGRVADEQRVARQHDLLVHDEGAVLGPVPRRVDHS
jgi:hypothetical protein